MDLNILVKSYSSALEKLLPMLQKKSKYSYIGVAILCLVLKQAYSLTVPPKALRCFPKIGVLTMFKSMYSKEPVLDRTKRLVTPLTNKDHKAYISKIPLNWTVYVTDPVVAKALLMKSDAFFPKSHDLLNLLGDSSPLTHFLGIESVAISNGEQWKKQRKIMNPAFHRAMPVKTFGETALDLFALIDQDSNNVPITVFMKNYTLDALGKSAFGFDFQAMKGDPEGWTKKYDIIVASLFGPALFFFAKYDFLLMYLSPKRRRVMKATVEFNEMLENLADKRRQEILDDKMQNIPDSEKDLLTLMIEADLHESTKTTTKELRENIALFFLAGHDTTANTLAFCMYNLAKNPHVQKKAREEILSILGDEPADVVPTMEDLKQMSYLDMVLKENLRRDGPVDKLMIRDTAKDVNLAGIFIPKNTKVSVDFAALHFNPKIWHNPESFIPERFEEGGEYDKHEGLTWGPFSGGSRQCLGLNFSLTEQRVLLSMILKRYEISISRDSEHYNRVIYDRYFSFAPKSLKLIFTRRY
ncbi:cytochrome P450 [Mycotypha africana]|uniref:cytochrome P450 n=1 Tax=Mycotypha africana TaxID=64632 RepID=UPI00230133F7|nr:cytochrome P450 [Mycotypha africana]KAI8988313.1 cytochrome P450 [Mycotypha africana]